jgi:hypothetical protein
VAIPRDCLGAPHLAMTTDTRPPDRLSDRPP